MSLFLFFSKEYANLTIESEPWTRAIIKRAENLRYKLPVFSQAWDIVDPSELVLYDNDSLESLAEHFSKMVSVQ